MSEPKQMPASLQDGVIGISWDYRCGFSSEHNFERVYKSIIDGVTVWKNATRNKTTYSIEEKKLKYTSEQQLLEAIKKHVKKNRTINPLV
jgi:hypothetical protein